MSDNLEISIDGLNSTLNRLTRTGEKMRQQVNKNLVKVGFLVAREASRNSPRREGVLEKQLKFQVVEEGVRVFVPINSPAGRYAERMHDGNYRRGKKTVAKGPRAGRLYIRRAINENKDKIISFSKEGFGTL